MRGAILAVMGAAIMATALLGVLDTKAGAAMRGPVWARMASPQGRIYGFNN